MKEAKRKKPHYNNEFKAGAVAKCEEIGVIETSKKLGVAPATLSRWRLEAQSEGGVRNGKPSYGELEKEVQKLKKELGYVNEVNRILKKSTAIFSSSEMGGSR